ncbi:MAG: alcohol dehydrogenase catalytic domain-containing protein [Clostridia bacterium]|nr:alcohol dehydrogenase catalytic domain-containing protein [Clostridia bacterium]
MLIPEKMKAAVFERKGVLNVKDIPTPKFRTSEDVLIKVKAVSICGTDVRALTDPPAFLFTEGIVVGHEFNGIVEAVGENVTNVEVGDSVVVHPNNWCGKCYYCRTGKINLCENFTHIGDKVDGAMAQYACVPEKLVYKISKDVPPYIACLAEPLACVLNPSQEVRVHPGETVVILGAGPIGLIFMMLYKAAGAKVIMSDIMENRRAFALELGADFVFDPGSQDLVKEVKDQTIIGADLVIDAVGFLMDQGIKLVRKGGNVILFGINESAKVEINQAAIVFNEINIHGKFITKGTFPDAIRIIENKIIPIEKLVTHRLGLEDVKKGLELMKSGEGSKVVIEM